MRQVLVALVLTFLLAPAARAGIAYPRRPPPRDTVLSYHPGPVTPRLFWLLRFQLGVGLAHGDGGVPGATLNEGGEAGSNMVVALSGLRPLGGWSAAGLKLRYESNVISLGTQSFTVGSWDALLQVELGRTALRRESRTLTPYLQVGAGWSFHTASPRLTGVWTDYVGPTRQPTALSARSSPALEAALGCDFQANRFISLNLQAGWRVDEPRYRMSVTAEPDRAGRLRLSGPSVRGGLKFFVAPLHGARR